MRILRSIIKLIGYPDYLPATLAATLLGGAAGGEGSLPRLGIAILSNLLLFTFAVIYQKIENAPVAATESNQKGQNPIASGEVSIKFSRTFSAIVMLLSLALAALLSPLNIALGFFAVMIAIALSHRSLNLGNSVLMHLGKQQTLLSVIFGVSGYLATAQKLKIEAILLTIFLLAFGFLFAAWSSEKTTRSLSRLMLIILLVFAVAAAYVLFIVLEVIPAWVLLLIVLFSSALSLIKHRLNPNQQSLSQNLFDTLTISTAVSLIISNLVQVFF
jgi:4-hydroxybenzoate polyprenyltransferase